MENTSKPAVIGMELAEEVQRLRKRVNQLEDENDALALAATREATLLKDVKSMTERIAELEEENKVLKETNWKLSIRQQASGGGDGVKASASSLSSKLAVEVEDPLAPFVVPGDSWLWHVAQEMFGPRAPEKRNEAVMEIPSLLKLQACHGGINVLCARLYPGDPDIVASGGADKSLLVSRLEKASAAGSGDGKKGAVELGRLRFAAPLLSMDFCPVTGALPGAGLLVAGGMDGKSHLVRVGPVNSSRDGDEGGDGDGDDDAAGDKDGRGKSPLVGVKHLTTLSDHSKYVVACRWAPDGSAFATASHDKVVTLYVRKGEPRLGVGSTGYEKSIENLKSLALPVFVDGKATRFYLPAAVETVEFVTGEGGALELAISACGQPHLTYVNLETMQQRKVSLNENDWDTHVSFTVMSLVASPDRKYLLGATDKSRIIMWRAGSNLRVRTMTGQSTDDFFQPRVTWDPSGMFSYCNSSGDSDVHVHCLASGRVIDRFKGHSTVVRDVYHHPSSPVLVTASYDKTVRVWGQ